METASDIRCEILRLFPLVADAEVTADDGSGCVSVSLTIAGAVRARAIEREIMTFLDERLPFGLWATSVYSVRVTVH